ncbi:unnamed protein product [Amoebophrya sp. A25]|nr:unnamed protein product [Amoebophrya sp. A25]|eukprot:GSA25T00015610001.1
MTRSTHTLVQRLQREDFCYREFPISVALHVFQLRILLTGLFIWLLMTSLLGIIFVVSQFLADQRLSLIVGEMEHARVHKIFKQMLFLPSKVVGAQIDMGIRAERMFEESDQQGLKALLEDVYDAFPTVYDVRVLFNQEDFGYYSSRQEGFQADTEQCADLGDYSCLAIRLKRPRLSWYDQGMLLFDPSVLKAISYCDFLSPQFIPVSERSGSPLLAQPPEATFNWHFGWARICKHEFAHLQGESGRLFSISKTTVNMETFMNALQLREEFTGGKIYIVRWELEVATIAAMTDRILGVQLSGATLGPPGELYAVDSSFDSEKMLLVLPGEYSTSGSSHVIVRDIRETGGNYLIAMTCPFYTYSDGVMLGLQITLLILFSLPFAGIGLVFLVRFYISKYRSGVKYQSVDEVIRKNVALAQSYVPANAKDRTKQATLRSANATVTTEGNG